MRDSAHCAPTRASLKDWQIYVRLICFLTSQVIHIHTLNFCCYSFLQIIIIIIIVRWDCCCKCSNSLHLDNLICWQAGQPVAFVQFCFYGGVQSKFVQLIYFVNLPLLKTIQLQVIIKNIANN